LGQFDKFPNPEAARKAYFTRLSLASAMARAASKKNAASVPTTEATLGGGRADHAQPVAI
jgi:hypothetical protein